MEEHAFIMELIAGTIFFCVGIRLYRLSRRTRQTPEYLVALVFLAWAFAFAIFDIPYMFTPEGESVAPAAAYGSLLAVNVGSIALALFTREVFRKRERWATGLVVAIALMMIWGADFPPVSAIMASHSGVCPKTRCSVYSSPRFLSKFLAAMQYVQGSVV